MPFTEEQHAVLTDLKEILRDSNSVSEQFGYDARQLKSTGRVIVEKYTDNGDVESTIEFKVFFE